MMAVMFTVLSVHAQRVVTGKVIEQDTQDAVIQATASILSGAVAGDHASPISDTTILASAGAQCNHIEHVNTQLPYVLLVAACSFVGYIVDGITQNGWAGLGAGLICMAAVCAVIYTKLPVVEKDDK